MAKLKNSIFHLELEKALHVYRAQELYVATKCWQQRIMSQQAKVTFKIFFNLNCKSEYVIYVM